MKCKFAALFRLLPILAVTLLIAVTTQTGCHSVKDPTLKVEKYDHTIRVACVGDSITWGDKITDRDKNCYPVTLGKLLGAKFDVRNFGVNGATLLKHGDGPYWKTRAYKEAQDFQPDVVIIMLGTNDSKPQNWKYKDEFMFDLQEMVTHFRYLDSKPKIWLCTPCPVYEEGKWGITPSVVANEIVPMVQQVAENDNLPIIDIFSAMSHRSTCFVDTVHPTAEGAEIIARTVAGALVGER